MISMYETFQYAQIYFTNNENPAGIKTLKIYLWLSSRAREKGGSYRQKKLDCSFYYQPFHVKSNVGEDFLFKKY